MMKESRKCELLHDRNGISGVFLETSTGIEHHPFDGVFDLGEIADRVMFDRVNVPFKDGRTPAVVMGIHQVYERLTADVVTAVAPQRLAFGWRDVTGAWSGPRYDHFGCRTEVVVAFWSDEAREFAERLEASVRVGRVRLRYDRESVSRRGIVIEIANFAKPRLRAA